MILHILKGRNLLEEGMKTKPLTVTIFVGGKQVDKLTEEQKERMAQKLSEAMSISYTATPEEFIKLKK